MYLVTMDLDKRSWQYRREKTTARLPVRWLKERNRKRLMEIHREIPKNKQNNTHEVSTQVNHRHKNNKQDQRMYKVRKRRESGKQETWCETIPTSTHTLREPLVTASGRNLQFQPRSQEIP